MAELRVTSPCEGLLPLSIGNMSVTEEDLGQLTLISPYKDGDLTAPFKDAHGIAWPAPNRATGKAGARAIWFGRSQVLLAGPQPVSDLADQAALVDQSDGWACVRLEGASARDVLARLVPIDVRPGVFKRGHTARTQIMHMHGSVTRIGETTYLLMVFRSMARTLVHDVKSTMEAVAARG